MATVVFTTEEAEWAVRDIQRQIQTNQPIGGKMLIINETNNKVLVPYAPQEIDHGDRGAKFDEASRVGTYSVMRRTSTKTPTLSFSLTLAAMGSHGKGNIVGYLNAFDIMSEQGQRVYIHFTSREQGAWLMTNYTAKVTHRDANQLPIRATVDLQFTRIMDEQAYMGPVNGGSSVLVAPPPAINAPAGSTPSSTSARTYVMKKGDTLSDVAKRFYGDPNKWQKIADASGIKNPKTIPVGKTVTIPA